MATHLHVSATEGNQLTQVRLENGRYNGVCGFFCPEEACE